MGGATLAHRSGEKEACLSLDPDICTRGSAFPSTKGLEGDSAAFLGDDGREEEEEDGEAMVCGWRKMAAV